MNLENILKTRSQNKCELCESSEQLSAFTPVPKIESQDYSALVCGVCLEQLSDSNKIDVNHWHCLNGSMWSEFDPVKVIAWRMLSQLSSSFAQSWAQDLLDQIYLEDDVLEWAKFGSDEKEITVRDSNGTKLIDGDSITLIKDLDVKGAGFTAKRGTLVKNIRLTDNPLHIEGKVNGTMIVLVSAYLKKV